MVADDAERQPRKSKQQQKREAEAAQVLGTALVELPTNQFTALINKLDLPAKLQEALSVCRTIKAREGRRRQLQYIGKLMRSVDCEPIERSLAEVKRGGQVATAQLHAIERWRERLLNEGDEALQELLRLQPQADAKQLQQLIARAHKEKAEQQPPRAARQLFRYLRELLAS
jgi:ribosome-associated protein